MFNVGGLTLHWYGIWLGIGVWVGLEISLLAFPKLKKEIEAAFTWALISGIAGARLYHVVDLWERYYRDNFWKVFTVWEGGLGIWGAIAGAVIGILLYSKFRKLKSLKLLDAMAMGAPVAQAIGRLGNRVNGELVGKNNEPLFAYEAFLNLILFIFLWKSSRKKQATGKILAFYLLGYGVIRILLENLRPNEIIWRIREVPTAMIFGGAAILAGGLILLCQKRS